VVDTQNAPAEPTGEPTSGAPTAPTSGPSGGPPKGGSSGRRIAIIVALGIIAGVLIYLSPRFFSSRGEPEPNYPRLEMAGTNTVFVLVENQWRGKYRDDHKIQLSYESTGTTTGVAHMLDGSAAIAFTHGALTAEQRLKAKEKGDVVHIPVVFFGVAPVYNVKELKGKAPLNLTGELLADIFLGKVTKWNDPAVAKINPGVPLPPTSITVVHREDSSGTTLVFTEYLDAVSAGEWRNKLGKPASAVKWPVGPNFVSAARNLGVATKVHETEGAIGYVDRMYTTYDEMVLDYAAVQNKDKSAFVRAEPANMTAAAAGVLANLPDDLVFDLTNKPGAGSYPISGVVYAVCYQNQPGETQKRVVDFLRWATHNGQAYATKMTLAPLPDELVKRIDKKLETIKTAP
jgi:phosphate transport system substrate-binding protein